MSDSKLLVAVSGGPDSLALAHVLQSLLGTGTFAELTVAHVNHGIREEAIQEESAVRRDCKEWNVPLEVTHAHTLHEAKENKTGIEETARKQRYEFFEELARAHGFDFVLTAHTANDQAETVLMHLVRGTGVRGLAGIPPKRKLGPAHLIRAWLGVTRNEILDYIEEFHLHPQHDTSNDELSYQRNRVRHTVMPALAEAWPDRSPAHSLAGLAERMRELSTYLDQRTQATLKGLSNDDGLLIDRLVDLHGFELHNLLEVWISKSFGRFALTARETARVEAWLRSSSQAMELHGGLCVKKEGRIIRIEKNMQSLAFPSALLFIDQPLTTPYGSFLLSCERTKKISKEPLLASFDAVAFGKSPVIRVRSWRKSDRMAPFGMEGKRKLVSDLLTEAHITGERRKNYPVVEWNDAILWLPGIRRSDFAKVQDGSLTTLELSFKPA